MLLRTLIRALLLFAIAAPGLEMAWAESSKDKALLGRGMWAAFECSVLASQSNDRRNAERLFNQAYRQGKEFVSAMSANKIDPKDLSTEVPWVVLALAEGPTPDFVLGRIYASAEEYALKDVLKTGDRLNSEGVRAALAQSKYVARNCALIAGAAK